MKIGYSRVSTRNQYSEAQHDALTGAGSEQACLDTPSGKLARRPELVKALLSANRTGDQLVVTKLDRLGRPLENLIELSNTFEARALHSDESYEDVFAVFSDGLAWADRAEHTPKLALRAARVRRWPARTITAP